jgi:hypothetical protein
MAAPVRRAGWVEPAAVALGVLAVVVLWLAVPTFPNYDAYYHLVWGRELLDGRAPSFEAYAAPTQHPLYIAVAAVVGLTGTGADRALVALTLLALVALTWATWRTGRALFGFWPGALAALFVGSSFAFLLYAVRAYVDVPFLALVLGAAAWELERGGRGRLGPMLLLVAAGLLRPEGWVLAGLYALWSLPGRSWRRRAAFLALAATPPLLWAAVDLAVTGNPLHSLNATSELADELGRPRGLAEVPGSFVAFVTDVARPPVALAGVLGVALAARLLGWRRLVVPLALLVAGAVTFVGAGLAGLSILPRYLTVPVIALCLFAGYAVAGFTTLPEGHPWRTRWRNGAVGAVVVGAAFLVVQLPSFGRLGDELTFVQGIHRDLEALLAEPAVAQAAACGPLSFPNYRLVPDARWLRDAPAQEIVARSAFPRAERPARGVAVFYVGEQPLDRYGFADGADRLANVPDAGFTPLARAGTLRAYVSCP